MRLERRRVRWFFAGLVAISAVVDIVGALLVQHHARSQALETLLPASVSLGGRTGAVLSGLALLLLAGGIARGKRVAHRLAIIVVAATVAFELVKDLDFEEAALFAWMLFGLFWFRHHFDADSNPVGLRWGLTVLTLGVLAAVSYGVVGALLLQSQLRPEVGIVATIEALAGGTGVYRALTARADWFLSSLPVVAYGLVIVALLQLLRPVLAPRAAASERKRVEALVASWGRNYISELAVHGASSYRWLGPQACVAYTLRGRTALALGDPICPRDKVSESVRGFVSYCEQQDWIPAFYQADDAHPYRSQQLTAVPIGSEAIVRVDCFDLHGRGRADLRYALHRSHKAGLRFDFGPGPDGVADHVVELREVSGRWLNDRRSPELGYSLGTLASLADEQITVGLAFGAGGRLEAFVSWLPVPQRRAWTLDLMRRRPDSSYGAIEALIVHSVDEARRRGIRELSLGMTPRVMATESGGPARALQAMYWGLDRFQRIGSLRRFKEKFGPSWEERYLVVPTATALPEVIVALVRAHVPPASVAFAGMREAMRWAPRRDVGRRVVA
jgi:phosphatidylglycerol lysyltransferase